MRKDKTEPTRAGFNTKREYLILSGSKQENKRRLIMHYAFHTTDPGGVITCRIGRAGLAS